MTEETTPRQIVNRRSVTIVLVAALVLVLIVVMAIRRPDPVPPQAADMAAPLARRAVYIPAEFGPQEFLLLGGSQLVNLFPQVLADIAAATVGEINLQILAGNPTDHARIDSVLRESGATATVVDLPVRTMWVRDFGPMTVIDQRGRRQLVDFYYRERRGNWIDNNVPGYVGKFLGLPVETSTLLVEGGDLITNGRGFGLISTRLINRNTYYKQLEPKETVTQLGALLGFESVSLAQPLVGESTGHVDMFAAFLATDLIVVGEYGVGEDADNAARLDALAVDLARQETRGGPLRVERIPMPDHNDGIWRTYTNVVFANGVLLVPVYPDYCPALDATVLAAYRKLLPDLRVVGIDASQLIRMRGALRCITMNVPQGKVMRRHH